MALWAEIYTSDNLVHVKFESAATPQGDPRSVQYVDITALSPQPAVGANWDGRLTFKTPAPPPTAPLDLDAGVVKDLLPNRTFTQTELATVLKKIVKKLYNL